MCSSLSQNVSELFEDDSEDSVFDNAVLGYVTPWNGLGYDMAKEHANRFTLIAPVWYQITKR